MTKKKKRRSKPKRFSILTAIAGLGGAVGSLNDRTSIYNTIKAYMERGDAWGLDNMVYDLMVQTLGVDPRDFAPGGTGFRFRIPTFTASLIMGGVGSKIAGKFVRPSTFDAIPYVGKRIKL